VTNIAILASGAGSNALNMIQHFEGSSEVNIILIASNKPNTGVLHIAQEHHIPTMILNKENFVETEQFLHHLQSIHTDFIVLAGFLWKVPSSLVKAFDHKIINIHPALLPKYGGKGMYGHFVHEAVAANNEKESGITIHFVNEHYDEGDIIFQAKAAITEEDNAHSIEQKVRALEMQHFPAIVEKVVRESKS
jgi:phosphoribosylglycinamide formyltransferase-1